MQTPFANLIGNTNAEVFAQLADAMAQFLLPTGVSVNMPAIFDEAYHRVDIGTFGASSIQPAISIQLHHLAPFVDPAAHRMPVTVVRTINAITQTWSYVVSECHPDGTGIALLLLELPAPEKTP